MTDFAESDEVLMERYAGGEAAAFGTLFRRHELRVWRYLERQVGNRASAEEVMQEVWFAVARDAVRFERHSCFSAWLFTIARNRMIDYSRRHRLHLSLDSLGYEAQAVVQQLTTEPSVGPLAAVVLEDRAQALNQALRQLPPEQRDAFLLQIEGDLSVEEVAAITRSSFETTKSRLRYARLKLRELLREYA
jgi:RNA polymerase sigma-70 factor (ECF subfamily)